LKARGLLHGDGPALAHIPFYENAAVIHSAIREFMYAFVNSFYVSDAIVRGDKELQDWAIEANGPAKAIDFPSKFDTREALIDALTHIAHLTSTVHHSVNTNNLFTISGTLPMHPASIYKPVPTVKGNTSVAAYLPPLQAALAQFNVEGAL
jgi:arachidonate 15-lipoxygenase (second type)/8-lipoxygenase (S-type)